MKNGIGTAEIATITESQQPEDNVNIRSLCFADDTIYKNISVGALSFATTEAFFLKAAKNTNISAVFTSKDIVLKKANSCEIRTLETDDPAGDFYYLHNYLYENTSFYSTFNFLPRIDEKVFIHPTVVLEEGVVIKSGSEIGPNVSILKGSIIGHNVTIKANTVIGAEGNATAYRIRGKLRSVHHAGGVEIGDNSTIGSQCLISRNVLNGSLKIGQNCQIDNCVHIGHNSVVGDDCILSAGTVVCGSVIIGDGCYLAPKTLIRDKIRLAPGTRTHLGAVVVLNSNENEILAGVYAMPHTSWMMKLKDERQKYL